MKATSSDPARVRALIHVLQDRACNDRDDAACALGWLDDKEAEDTLIAVAGTSDEGEDILDRCRESLAQIWARKGRAPEDALNVMMPAALHIALATLAAEAPALAEAAANTLDIRARDRLERWRSSARR